MWGRCGLRGCTCPVLCGPRRSDKQRRVLQEKWLAWLVTSATMEVPGSNELYYCIISDGCYDRGTAVPRFGKPIFWMTGLHKLKSLECHCCVVMWYEYALYLGRGLGIRVARSSCSKYVLGLRYKYSTLQCIALLKWGKSRRQKQSTQTISDLRGIEGPVLYCRFLKVGSITVHQRKVIRKRSNGIPVVASSCYVDACHITRYSTFSRGSSFRHILFWVGAASFGKTIVSGW